MARKPASKAPCYPDLPDDISIRGRGDFWLAIAFRTGAEYEALQNVLFTTYKAKRENKVLQMALCGAMGELERATRKAIKDVIKEGLLPFAHAHTTYFDQQVAV
jgi:hypothetical protein